jgi:hypothetical protein
VPPLALRRTGPPARPCAALPGRSARAWFFVVRLVKAHPPRKGAGRIYLVQFARGLPSGSGTKFLKCRAFQPVKVAYAGGRLLKDVLRHFERRDGLPDQEATIRDYLVQRLPHYGDCRCIVFLFQIAHGRFIEFFCEALMN